MTAAMAILADRRFLDADQIVEMHDELLSRWGGNPGGGHRGAGYEGVEAAVQAVKNSYYDTAEELAAAYAVYIVQGHVFLDGNKRAGAAALATFLAANRIPLRITSLDLARLMIELQVRSERGERTDDLIRWMASLL